MRAQPGRRLRSHSSAGLTGWRVSWCHPATSQKVAAHQRDRGTCAHDTYCSAHPLGFAGRLPEGSPEPLTGAAGTLDTMADQEEANPSEPAPDEGDGTKGWNEWVRRNFSARRFLRPVPASRGSGAANRANLSPADRSAATKAAVNNLDARERRIGFFALAFELALTAIVVVPYLTHHVKVGKSDQLKTLGAVHVFLIEGLVVGLFLLLGVLIRRRALFGFASLATGIWLVELPALRVFGLAYFVLGMWLLFRGLKSQQNASRGTSARPASQPRPSRRSRAAADAVAARSAPKPNKRYTPPKPTRRPPAKKPASARAEPQK